MNHIKEEKDNLINNINIIQETDAVSNAIDAFKKGIFHMHIHNYQYYQYQYCLPFIIYYLTIREKRTFDSGRRM